MKYDTTGWVHGPVLQEVMALGKNLSDAYP
jgi:hypothetical protein